MKSFCAVFCALLFVCLLALPAAAQTTVAPFLNPHQQFYCGGNSPCASGKLYTCSAGSACPGNPLATYTDSTGTVPNANPIILDSNGAATVWLSPSSYKFVLQNSQGVQQWVVDNVTWSTPPSTFNGLIDNGAFTMQQPTAATSGANQSSFQWCQQGQYWNGSASAADQWCWQDVLGTGTNPTSTLTISHSGTPGTAGISFGTIPLLSSAQGPLQQLNGNGASRFLADNPMGPYLLKVNPLLDTGQGAFDAQIVGDLWMIKDPATGKFHALYSCVPVGFASSNICHATSDDGINWTKDAGNPVLSPGSGWDSVFVVKPTVVPNICGSAWCMYLLGNTGASGGFGLFTASSLNGPWTAYSGNPILQPGGAQQATSFLAVSAFVENGTLNLIYAASDSVDFVNRIFLATSTDGKTFTKQGKIVDVGAGGQWDSGWIAPGSIVKTAEGQYVMSYNAGNGVPAGGNLEPSPQGIGFMYTTDATLKTGWTRYTANPVIQTDTIRFESNTVWRGYLIQIGGKYYLIVDAGDNSGVERQFIAEQVRTQPSSTGGTSSPTFNSLQVKSLTGCITFNNPNGGRSLPVGQYQLCSRGDVDAISLFRCGATSTETACNNSTELARWPTGGGLFAPEIAAPSGLASFDALFPNSTGHRWNMINNNGSADTVVGAATTDTFTNKTLDTAGAGNVVKVNGTQLTAVHGNTATVQLQDGNSTTSGDLATFDGNGNTHDSGVLATSVPQLVGTPVNLTAQAANISSTAAVASGSVAGGWYLATCHTVISQAATTSSTLPQCSFTFTDADTSQAAAVGVTSTSTTNTVGTTGLFTGQFYDGSIIHAKASTAINYSTASYASVGGTPMQYAIHVKVYYLGP